MRSSQESSIVNDLRHYFDDDEFDSELSPEKLKIFTKWNDVMAKQKIF